MIKRAILSLCAAAAVMVAAAAQPQGDAQPEWQNPHALGLNKLTPHSYVWPYADAASVDPLKYDESPWYKSLNGMWKFHWNVNPDNRPAGFQNPSYDVSAWDNIRVPGNWERQGYGTAIYVNETYEFDDPLFNFKKNPPFVPYAENEVGSYRRTFTVPQEWDGRRVVLCFEGVISFYYVWLNGELLGYNQDSKTAAEWDITDRLQKGENTLALEVYRWSSGSYLECQDFWRLSGIERDVYLYSTPKYHIADYKVISTLERENYRDGEFSIEAVIEGPKAKKNLTLTYELTDSDGRRVASESAAVKAGGRATVDFAKLLPGVKAWSAEHPDLYKLTLTLDDGRGNVHTTGCEVGFRTSEIRGGQFCINGTPILVKGVNHHEHSQAGRYQSVELMKQDIELMKQYNINTVRNSHYPNAPQWYALCNRYGLYMIDEANIESHGMGYGPKSLAKDTMWLAAHLDRTERMYQRSKNHPSIVIWSLGNEAGNGVNFHRTYDWLKAADPTRPIQYERAEEDYNTDIYCRMYRSVEDIEEYVSKPGIYRPFILCEYLHAMGNSCGGMKEYWDVFEREPMAQGGSIWDWVDQGFDETGKGGRHYWTYGGDYGPENVPSFDNFCCNGLVSADRVPHPHLEEVKKIYQYIKCRMVDEKTLTVAVKNWFDFTDLSAYRLHWTLRADDGTLIDGGFRNVACAPHGETTLTFGEHTLPAGTGEAFLDLSWEPVEAPVWAPAGWEEAYDQFVVDNGGRNYVVAAPDAQTEFTVDPSTGAVVSLRAYGREMLKAPVTVSLYRPITDNDNRDRNVGKLWKPAGLDNISQRVTSLRTDGGATVADVELVNAAGRKVGTAQFVYTLENGALKIETTVNPDAEIVKSLARAGLTFAVAGDCGNVDYFGRGNFETYVDRNQAGRIGRWHTTAADMFHPYVRPQACGNRTDVRWGRITDAAGCGLYFTSERPFQFGALPYTDEMLDAARHLDDLEPCDCVTVHIDAEQAGVGTATCGPGVLPQYQVPVGEHRFVFWLTPVTPQPQTAAVTPDGFFEQSLLFPEGASVDDKAALAARLIPSARQLAWQRLELTAFLHFGINTFTDREWGNGREDPALFNPSELDARQWVRTLKECGFGMVILTAKHHDGFCLWPTATTPHSVASSPWRGGRGDVVREVSEACAEFGMKFGVYLSPWDRNAACYGNSPAYNRMFVDQLTELLTRYGKVDEVWFDGACAEGPNGRKQEYDWTEYIATIRRLQPDAVSAIMGNDVRWVGNERGQGRETEWSATVLTPESYARAEANKELTGAYAKAPDLGSREMLAKARELFWYPSEVDVSVRPGWFWHEYEAPKSLGALTDIYFNSVGRNSVLLLNVPPDRRGLLDERDVARLYELRAWLDATFADDRVVNGSRLRTADAGKVLTYTMRRDSEVDAVMLCEYIEQGQRIESFTVEVRTAGGWREVARGTTVGNKRLLRFEPVRAKALRVRIVSSRGRAQLSRVGAFRTADIAGVPASVAGGATAVPVVKYAQESDGVLTINLPEARIIKGFVYSPAAGRAAESLPFRYRVTAHGRVVAVGEFGNMMHNPQPQRVEFSKPVNVGSLRIEAATAADTTAAISASEIELLAE